MVNVGDMLLIVILLLVPTILPEAEFNLNWIWKSLLLSDRKSNNVVLVKAPIPFAPPKFIIANEPVKELSLKSLAVTLPIVEKNISAPSGISVVVTLNVTDSPSLIDVADWVMVKVGITSITSTDWLVATIGPDVEPVLTINVNVSVPSVRKSFTSVLVIVAIPVVAPVPTILNEPVRDPSEKSSADTVPLVL